MRNIGFLVLLFYLSSFACLADTENIDMFVGEVRVLGKVDVERVAVGQGKVVKAQVLENGELLVIAQSEGASSLHLWHRNGTQSSYNIHVLERDPETRVRMETMVRMRVRIVEFRKSALRKLGIDWSKEITGPTLGLIGDAISSKLYRPPVEQALGAAADLPLTIKPFSTYFGLATAITSRINYLASTGDAVTLAEPTLSCVNGGTASFLSGGEVPYPVVGANGQVSIEFKEYGIRLNISPRVDEAGEIRTRILTEVSQIDPAVSVQGAPGLLTRRAQTEVNVLEGQTIVIAGLLSAENGNDVDKVPGLGDIPVLGGLFRTTNRSRRLTELVIFITPELDDPRTMRPGRRAAQMLEEGNKQLTRLRKDLDVEIMD